MSSGIVRLALSRARAPIGAQPLIRLRLSSLTLAKPSHPSPARGEGEVRWADEVYVIHSAPREGRVRGRVQLAFGEAAEAERAQQIALVAADIVRHQLADADHLVAVVAVGDHVNVVAEPVEHRERIRGEAADAARR